MTRHSQNAASSQIDRTGSARRRGTRALFIFFVLVAALWALSPIRVRLEQQRELNGLLKDKERLAGDNARLRDEIFRLELSPGYIEWLARKELGLIKSDEEAFVVIKAKARR